ncbi:MAG: ornithine cyclodeaminase family protein [Methanobacteriota archaeon]|nr:MAG: ornithine cyclodeaminase family protein [Euryarchaeota archaeon]
MSGELLYLSAEDVQRVGLPIVDVIDAVEAAFAEKGKGGAEMPPKPGIHPMPDSFIHAMPAYLKSMNVAGMKWVSGFPGNRKRGLPYITGLIVLNDHETGLPTCVMDASWVTAKRTAAATAVAAKHLASPSSAVFGILGCGVQGRTNLEANDAMFDLERVLAYDLDRDVATKYASDMKMAYGLEVKVASGPKEVVEGSDIVVTAGPILKHPTPVIEAGWLRKGCFACPLDFDSYWKPEAMHDMDKFCTDDVGQLEYYRTVGYFSDIPAVYADMAEIVIGERPGRESPEERIMSMNLGVAVEDMVTAARVVEAAKRKGVGTWLPL